MSRQVGETVTVSDDGSGVLSGTLAALVEYCGRTLDCSECGIYEYLAGEQALRSLALWGLSLDERDRAWVGQRHPLSLLPAFERVLRLREPVASYPETDAFAEAGGPQSMAYWGEQAALWAPLVLDDEVLGLFELVEHRRRRHFSEDEIHLAVAMAGVAAVTLRTAREAEAAEARNRQLQALIASARAMTSTLDLEAVLQTICREAANALGTSSSYIYRYDPEQGTLTWLAEYQRDPGHTFAEPLGTVYHLRDWPHDLAVVARGETVELRLDDPALDPATRALLTEWREQSTLMVPMTIGDEVIGILEVSETGWPRRFTAAERELCRALGEQAAVAMNNALLHRRLQEQKELIERQAVTDGLTGLANHRHFWERLRDEVARARRYGHPLSLLMLDIDDFKLVNDRHGHQAGDRVLKGIGEVLLKQTRVGVDLPARYGGEEFAVLLPQTDSEDRDGRPGNGAAATAERIRRAVARRRVRGPDGSRLQVTVSVGVATFPRHAGTADQLVNKADAALYEAKRRGKDQVVVYSVPVEPRQ